MIMTAVRDRHSCNNWRGISVLDVVGKLFTRVLQDRLEPLVEYWLPESQCWFPKGMSRAATFGGRKICRGVPR